MISLYSGTPGSGKSLHLAERLYYRIKNTKSTTIGNFALFEQNIKGKKRGNYINLSDEKLTPQYLVNFSKEYMLNHGGKIKEGQFLLVIDEAQRYFNPRDWCLPNRKEWLEFFSLHRHLGYDIILISQHDRMLDRQVRALIEYEWIHRKVTNFGWIGKLLYAVNGFRPFFVCIKMWYPMRERMNAEFFRLNKKYMRIYDTFGMFGSSDI